MKEYEYPNRDSIPQSIMDSINTFIDRERTTVITFGENVQSRLPDPEHEFKDYEKIIMQLRKRDKIDDTEYSVLWSIGNFFHNVIHKTSPQEILIEANELGVTPENLWEEVQNQTEDFKHIDVGYLWEQSKGAMRERMSMKDE
jgi:SOS response regulatory protein OraA/RecX